MDKLILDANASVVDSPKQRTVSHSAGQLHIRVNKFAAETLYRVKTVHQSGRTTKSRDVRMSDEPLAKADWVRAALEQYERPLIRYAARITGNI